MAGRISAWRFLRNVVVGSLVSGFFFGVIGLLVAGGVGFQYMAIMGLIFGLLGSLCMGIAVALEVNSWRSLPANMDPQAVEERLWFLKKKS